MKQIEVTTRVNQSLEEVDNLLTKQGFQLIRKSRIEDRYMILKNKKVTQRNIIKTLQNCLLIRYLLVNETETLKKITYKNKTYHGKTVMSEEKINVSIDDIDKMQKLLECVGFRKLVDVKYDVIVYQKNHLELAFQNVEGLGLLLEYENNKDFSQASDYEIIKEKEKMLEEIKQYQLNVTEEYDIKKAYELVKKQLENSNELQKS